MKVSWDIRRHRLRQIARVILHYRERDSNSKCAGAGTKTLSWRILNLRPGWIRQIFRPLWTRVKLSALSKACHECFEIIFDSETLIHIIGKSHHTLPCATWKMSLYLVIVFFTRIFQQDADLWSLWRPFSFDC